MNNMIDKLTYLRESLKQGKISKSEIHDELQDIRDSLTNISSALKFTDIIDKIEFLSGGDVIFHFENFRLYASINVKEDIISNLLVLGSYEGFILKIIDRLCPSDGVFIDIGANIGYLSLFLARIKSRMVYSFEASSFNFSALLNNIKLNKAINVMPFNTYLGDKLGTASFFYDADNPGASSSRVLIESNKHLNEIVKTNSLDLMRLNLNRIDLIKIDVEGSELFVIQGALETIARFRPFILCEMLRKWGAKFDYSPSDIITVLCDMDYVLYEIVDDSIVAIDLVDEETIGTNFLFVPKEDIKILNDRLDGFIIKSNLEKKL
jgi:FkbM family methyltransferase